MAEDLGQDVGEYLLNHRSDAWRTLKSIALRIEAAKQKREQAQETERGEEIISLDFDTEEDAARAGEALSELGIDHSVVQASIIIRSKDADIAAKMIERVEKITAPAKEEPIPEVEDTVPLQSEPVADCALVTEKQIGFIEQLYQDGYLDSKDMPDDLGSLPKNDADRLIKQGINKRDLYEGRVRLRAEGAADKAAAKALAEKNISRTREKVLDKAVPSK